jgi:hypothetical protein
MAPRTRRLISTGLLRLGGAAMALAAVGCVVAPEPQIAGSAIPPEAIEAPHALPPPFPPPRPVRKPPPPVAAAPAEPVEAAEAAEPETPPAEVAAAEPVDPERVIGLGEVDTAGWLGPPAQQSEAPPATIWRYTSRDCEIDLYFYLDLQNRVMRALHYEVRSNDIVERRSERCFQQLVDERRQRQGSGTSAAYHPR